MLESFLSTWALLRVASFGTSNLLVVVFFLLCFSYYKKIDEMTTIELNNGKQIKDSTYYLCFLVSAIFTWFYINGNIELICKELDSALFLVSMTAIITAGLLVIFYKTMLFLFLTIGKFSSIRNGNSIKSETSKKLPILAFFLCLISWTPYLLMNYPGVMTPDSISQYAQIIGAYSQSNHHPWIHTQVISLFYHIGLIFTDNANIAISFFTIFQMCFMALCIAYLIATLRKFAIKKWLIYSTIAFYTLIPYHGMYVVTIWKDIIFSGAVLIYVCALLRLCKDKKLVIRELIIFFFSGLAMCVFRTNGWYVFLLMLPIIIVTFRKQWKVMIPIQFLTVMIVLIIHGPVMTHFKVEQPDLIESLSIPSQQIARVFFAEKEITEEQMNFLKDIVDIDLVKPYYNPYNSGGFKRLVREGNQEYLRENFSEFVIVWLEMGIKHPEEYIVAYRDQTMGYWYPFTDTVIGTNEGIIENEFGLQSTNLIQSKVVVKAKEILFKLPNFVPLYGILWSAGGILWCVIVLMAIVAVYGKKRYLLIYLPNIGLFLSLMVATPLSNEFRYAYAMVFCFPLYFIAAFLKQD